jgi:hypothetical protein
MKKKKQAEVTLYSGLEHAVEDRTIGFDGFCIFEGGSLRHITDILVYTFILPFGVLVTFLN